MHGYRDADLLDQPTFSEVWPEFRAFVGDDLLVAHNGQQFDVPVLRRLAAGLPGARDAGLLRHPAARPVAAGRERPAGGPGPPLRGVGRPLAPRARRRGRARRRAPPPGRAEAGAGAEVGAGAPARLAGTGPRAGRDRRSPPREERLLRELTLPATLGRFGDCLEVYAEERDALPDPVDAPSVEELIERLGGARLMERIRTTRPAAQRYPSSVARPAGAGLGQRGDRAGREHRPLPRPDRALAERRLLGERPAGSTCSPCIRPRDWNSPGSTSSARRMPSCPDSPPWSSRTRPRSGRRGGCSTWE